MAYFYSTRKYLYCLTILSLLLLAACSPASSNKTPSANSHHTAVSTVLPQASSQTDQSAIDRLIATTGCGKVSPITPGTSASVTIDAHPRQAEGYTARNYLVHVPINYSGDHPVPAVLIFHGYGGNPVGMEKSTAFSKLADQQDFIAVYPQGLPDGPGGPSFWASIGPYDYGVDDALFVSDVLNRLQSEFCIDARRIYATGFSNGGAMAAYVACTLGMRIAAFAPVSGNFYAIPGGCYPGRPLPILDIHGTADPLLPYNGIPSSVNPQWPLPAIPDWLHDWAVRDGCTVGPVIFLQTSMAVGEQWTHCLGDGAVVHYRMIGEGHSWPRMIGSRSGTEAIWDFLEMHTLPG
ncbi:MAG TPA: PHB depolymerase family esterase [Ktedonobacteraceae bacterium]|jgi:polyhydroxybutyrate depolymerase|nr:PHB depolymerase family esterase [Ktedonobacteraceae bacterium]